MTDSDPTPTTTKARLPIRLWRGFVNIFMMPVETVLGGLVLASLVVFAGGTFLWDRIEDSDRAQRDADRIRQLDEAYAAAHSDWRRNGEEFDSCLTSATDAGVRVEQLRAVLFSIVDLNELFPDSEAARLFTATKTAEIETQYPPIDVAARQALCVDPGPEPIDPTPEEP